MKRFLLTLCSSLMLIWSVIAMAENIGVVDMRQLFQTAPQIKAINADLDKNFSPERDKLVAMGKSLQEEIKKFQRNQSVMSPSDMTSMKDKITKQEEELRLAQASFQQKLLAAQNKAMSSFMTRMNQVVQSVAQKRQLDLVLEKNSVLFAKGSMDITSEVMSGLKK